MNILRRRRVVEGDAFFRFTRRVLLGAAPVSLFGRVDHVVVLAADDLADGWKDSDLVGVSREVGLRAVPSLADAPSLEDHERADWVDGQWRVEDRVAEMARQGLVWTTAQIMRGRRAVLVVSRDDEGDYQYLDGHSIKRRLPKLVHLAHLTEADPTLLDVPPLQPGEHVERTSIGHPWQRCSS